MRQARSKLRIPTRRQAAAGELTARAARAATHAAAVASALAAADHVRVHNRRRAVKRTEPSRVRAVATLRAEREGGRALLTARREWRRQRPARREARQWLLAHRARVHPIGAVMRMACSMGRRQGAAANAAAAIAAAAIAAAAIASAGTTTILARATAYANVRRPQDWRPVDRADLKGRLSRR